MTLKKMIASRVLFALGLLSPLGVAGHANASEAAGLSTTNWDADAKAEKKAIERADQLPRRTYKISKLPSELVGESPRVLRRLLDLRNWSHDEYTKDPQAKIFAGTA